MAEPKLVEIRESARQLYVSLSEYRVGAMIEENEVQLTEAAQVACTAMIGDLDKMISTRAAKAEAGS